MDINNANEEILLILSVLKDINFKDDKNGLNDLSRMENVIKYFVNKGLLSLSFIKLDENKLKKAEQLVKMIDNIKVDNSKKIEIFDCIINYLVSLKAFCIKIVGDKYNLTLKKDLYDLRLHPNGSVICRNKIYTDGSFKYDLSRDIQNITRDIQYIKCENNAKFLMNVAVSENNNDILTSSGIHIKDFNFLLPSLEEIQSAGFPKMSPVDACAISMTDVRNIKFREVYESVNLEDYKTLVKK